MQWHHNHCAVGEMRQRNAILVWTDFKLKEMGLRAISNEFFMMENLCRWLLYGDNGKLTCWAILYATEMDNHKNYLYSNWLSNSMWNPHTLASGLQKIWLISQPLWADPLEFCTSPG